MSTSITPSTLPTGKNSTAQLWAVWTSDPFRVRRAASTRFDETQKLPRPTMKYYRYTTASFAWFAYYYIDLDLRVLSNIDSPCTRNRNNVIICRTMSRCTVRIAWQTMSVTVRIMWLPSPPHPCLTLMYVKHTTALHSLAATLVPCRIHKRWFSSLNIR